MSRTIPKSKDIDIMGFENDEMTKNSDGGFVQSTYISKNPNSIIVNLV
jgi:hypothetical protein